jgi:MFS family permease
LDIFGRKALYLAGGCFSIVVAFPLFWAFETSDPVIITLALMIAMTLTHALLFGPKAAFMPELFSTRVRYSGASLGANVAAALSGGFSPLIATALFAQFGQAWPISLYIIALSLMTIVATLLTHETAWRPLK